MKSNIIPLFILSYEVAETKEDVLPNIQGAIELYLEPEFREYKRVY